MEPSARSQEGSPMFDDFDVDLLIKVLANTAFSMLFRPQSGFHFSDGLDQVHSLSSLFQSSVFSKEISSPTRSSFTLPFIMCSSPHFVRWVSLRLIAPKADEMLQGS